jgi:hypothetical protein
MTLVLVPVAARNLAAGGELHLTTAQLGPNLYIGNHAGASGSYEPLVPGHGSARDERADATRVAEEAIGRPLGPGEVSGYWTPRALSYIRSQPGNWLTLMARKTALALTPFSFGVLLALAAGGTVLTAPRAKRLGLLYGIGLAYLASVVLFYVVGRYRFPLVPILLLLAAGGVAELIEHRRRHGARTLTIAAPRSNGYPIENLTVTRFT